jgi:hypothetical protein
MTPRAKRPGVTSAAIVRAVKGAEAAGLKVAKLDICTHSGTITVHTLTAPEPPKSPLELWQANRHENAPQRHP